MNRKTLVMQMTMKLIEDLRYKPIKDLQDDSKRIKETITERAERHPEWLVGKSKQNNSDLSKASNIAKIKENKGNIIQQILQFLDKIINGSTSIENLCETGSEIKNGFWEIACDQISFSTIEARKDQDTSTSNEYPKLKRSNHVSCSTMNEMFDTSL